MRARQISFIVACLFLYGGYSYSGYRIFLVALVVLLLLALVSLIQLHWVRSRLVLSQTLEPDPVYTDDAAHLVIEITSRTRLPVAVLEIVTEQKRADTLKLDCASETAGRLEAASLNGSGTAGMKAEALLAVDLGVRVRAFLLPIPDRIGKALGIAWQNLRCRLRGVTDPKGQKTVQVILRHNRMTSLIGRGRFRETIRLRTDDARIFDVSACQVGIQDPFGLFRLSLRCTIAGNGGDLRLHVLPRPDKKLLAIAWLQNNREGLNATQHLSDEVNAVADVHQMNPGDSFKRIHWIVSAKQNQWMIKRFEKDEQAHVLLLPDLGSGRLSDRLQPLRRDSVLGLTAAAVQQLLQSELSVLLVTSDRAFRATFASRSDQLLDLLIHLAAAPDESDDPLRHQALEGLARLPDDAMIIFVTATPDEELSSLSADLIKSGHRVMVIQYENPLLATLDTPRQVERLTSLGVRIIPIRESDPVRLHHPERLHGTHRTDGWRQVRRGTLP